VAKIVKFCLVIFGLQILVLSSASFSVAQVDPTKVLVGKWEGLVEIAKNRERTLIINSVEPSGSGEWVARGRIGLSWRIDEEKEGGGKIKVFTKDNEIHLDLPGKTHGQLKLIGENKLEGTIEAADRGKVAPRRISFEKMKDVK
jgi:hypothetical protein